MKFRPNRHYTTVAIYAFLVVAAAILFYEAVMNFSAIIGGAKSFLQFVQPVVNGFIFAFLLNPMLRMYDDRVLVFLSRGRMSSKPRRVIGLLLTYVTIFLIVGLFFRMVIPQLLLSIESLFDTVPKYLSGVNNLYYSLLRFLEDFEIISGNTELEMLLGDLTQKVRDTLNGLFEGAYEYLAGLIPQVFSASARITSSLINFLLGIIISIYFLFDREKLFAQAKKICNALFSERINGLIYDVATDANRVFSGFIVGKIIDSAIIGLLCFIVMAIAGWEFPVLISVIVGVTNIIPYFGPFIGAIPSILILLIVNPMQALLFGIFVLLLQQFDGNILGPKILGDTTGLSALWVIFAIMLFSGLFGVLGMFIGVPLFALIYTTVKRIVAYLLSRKGKSTDTRDYASDKNPLI